MPLVIADRVKETTTTTGTGTLTLAGAVSGFQSFSVVGNANTTFYCIAHQTLNEWEVGIGTYTSSGTTLARTTVLSSSNSGSAVSFSAGTKDVFVVSPAIFGSPFILAPNTTNPAVQFASQTIISSTAGNARGKGAVDLQLRRDSATKVASGTYTFCAGRNNTASYNLAVAIGNNNIASYAASLAIGNGNTSSGNASIVIGSSNQATGAVCVAIGSGNYSTGSASVAIGSSNYSYSTRTAVVGGLSNRATSKAYSCVFGGTRAVANKYAQRAYAAGRFAANGDAQTSEFVLRRITSDATQSELFLDGSSERMAIVNDSTVAFNILLVARRTDTDNESAGYWFQGVIDRNGNAASTAIVGTITKTVLAEDTSAWDADVDADTTNGSLRILVTGEASKTIRWVAYVRWAEVVG